MAPRCPSWTAAPCPSWNAIEQAGLQPQDAPRNWYELKEPIWFETEERGTEMLGVPAPGGEFRLTVMVDYNSPVLGTQHASMYRATSEFKAEIAPCRTFVFLRELEQLAKAGSDQGRRPGQRHRAGRPRGHHQGRPEGAGEKHWAASTRTWRSAATACSTPPI
jgi:hypothetical protein